MNRKLLKAICVGGISLMLAVIATLAPIPAQKITINEDGINLLNGIELGYYSHTNIVNVAVDKTLAVAKLNKASSQIHDGLIYLRYDLYLLPNAPGYQYHYVYVTDQTSTEYKAGYKGTIGKDGKPDPAAYQLWYNNLPKTWVNNPFLCVFVSVPSTIGYADIQVLGTTILNNAYSGWVSNYSALTSASVIRPLLNVAKSTSITIDATKSAAEKNTKLTAILNDSRIDTLNPSGSTVSLSFGGVSQVLAAPIDMGSTASDRASDVSLCIVDNLRRTAIDYNNAANDDGVIDTVEAWFLTADAGNYFRVGTFTDEGAGTFTCYDSEAIGSVTSGSKQTYTGLTINVLTGQYIGGDAFNATGALNIDRATSGGGGVYYNTGAWNNNDCYCDPADSGSFSILSGDIMSLYATGATEGVAAPTNVSATDGAHTDKVVVTWTQVAGANAYKVLQDATNVSGTLGDVATYDDTDADAPTITAGSAVATDGTFTDKIRVSLAGSSANNGTTHSYTVYASADGGTTWSDASAADNGFRGVGALTYQWQKSASTTDDTYSNIGGATTDPYDDSAAPAGSFTSAGTITASDGTSNAHVLLESAGVTTTNGAVRWYKCVLNATGAAQQTSASNDGYRSVGGYTYQWQRSAADSDAGYSDIVGATTTPYSDVGAPAGVITPGTATASDGTSSAHVTLTLSGQSSVAGAGRYYKLILSAAGAADVSPAVNRGYRSIGALTYQWQVSAADADAAYGDIAGGTTNPYNYTTAPDGTVTVTTQLFRGFGSDWIILEGNTAAGVAAAGRFYLCVVSASGATPQNSTANRGYKDLAAITEYGFDYGLTTAYGSDATTTDTITAGTSFVETIRGLTPGTVYHFRAKVLAGAWSYGVDLYVCTKGSPVIYEYLNTGGDGDSDPIYGVGITAQQFTAQTTSHTALYIQLPLKRVGAAPGDVYIELKHATAGDEPTGLAIASAILDGDLFSTSYLYWQFVLDEVNLIGGNKYAIVVSVPLGDVNNHILWQMDTGGGLADAVGLHSVNGGTTWVSDTPTDYLFEIWGNSCVSVARALAVSGYIESGDILFLLEYINTYPPYATDGSDSKLYFAIRLLDTDGLTIIASTPQILWGNRPGAVYLSAAEASAITLGGGYYLEVYGLFTGNPSASYQLVSTDWSGTIGSWIIGTANNMEAYYGLDTFAIYSLKVKGEVLNDGEGAASFLAGVPYLMETHPELFLSQVIKPSFTATTAPVAPLAGSWQDQVGAGIAGVFTSFGTMFGISGKYIGSVLLGIMYLGLVVSVGSKGGSPLIAAAIAFPIIGFGVWAFLVDFVLIGVVIMILAIIALIGYWVTRT